ncbi:MAG: tyrosine-type recombinase/integrase [Anaerolineaceae bacterium]|nr:tyrosine-type recombinase/integrase [Anaerolineaceae bacterium]
MDKKLSIKLASEGFIYEKTASGLSEHTISDYYVTFKKLFLYFPEDTILEKLSRNDLLGFFNWLQTDYVSEPGGVAPRGKIKLAPKSIANIHTNLSSFWTWAVKEGYVKEHIIRKIPKPRHESPVIEPFTKDQIEALLKACENKKAYNTKNKTIKIKRDTAVRDKAIIMVLLDTGIRVSEICDICIQDLNLTEKTIKVGGKGKGRDKKERIVHLGKTAASIIHKHILPRLEELQPDDPLFFPNNGVVLKSFNRSILGKLLKRIGDRAGVPGVHPHRFRHTFGITYLRNGGDIFTLQRLLGHSDLNTVKIYARIANCDTERMHRKASPVDNWRL